MEPAGSISVEAMIDAITNMQAQVNDLRIQNDNLQTENENLKKQISSCKSTIKSLEMANKSLNDKLNGHKHFIDHLNDMPIQIYPLIIGMIGFILMKK